MEVRSVRTPQPALKLRSLAAAGLALLVIATFLPVVDNGFVSFDDDVYIVNNPHVRGGLTLDGIRWAFTSAYASNWHPLTWLSHMLDVSLFGLHPQGHHLVGLLLHTATALLALAVLHAMTGALWPSALAAALFAVHPLRVESVAWAAERKDLLSGFFVLLALSAYLRYVRRPAPLRLILVVVAMSVGLLAKPMAVTLPFALLVLDWWPLGRLRISPGAGAGSSLRVLLLEKSPLFLLSALSAAVTLTVQSLGGATGALSHLSWGVRLSNAMVSYTRYLGMTFWPVRLSVFYPHPEDYWPFAMTLAAVAVLAALSLAAVLARRRAPALAAGWLWFLGTLVPVIGLVQTGGQAMADRYTYLPSLGIVVALVWGTRQLAPSRTAARAFAVLALLVCLCLMLLSRRQVAFWRDSRALFGHALVIDGGNWLAHLNYGASLSDEGRFAEAVPHYRAALRLQPSNPKVLSNLGVASSMLGRHDDAVDLLRRALENDPQNPERHYNLGIAWYEAGNPEEAGRHFADALRLDPKYRDALYNLGVLAVRGGRPEEAERFFQRALAVDPGMAAAIARARGLYYNPRGKQQ